MKKLKIWWKTWIDKDSNEYFKRLENNYKREAENDVQPLIWNGKLYIAYQGIPLIEVSELKGELLDSVEQIQKTVCHYTHEKMTEC